MAQTCPYCGTTINGAEKYCPVCGGPVQNAAAQPAPAPQQTYTPPAYPQQTYSQQPYQPTNPQQTYQPTYSQQPYQTAYPQQPGVPLNQAAQQQLPMNWFKFVIYFQLFAACVVNAITGLVMVSGNQYGPDSTTVYRFIPDLQPVDMIYGVMLIATAVLAIIARVRLSKFCSNGPTVYYVYLATQIVLPIFYVVATSMAVSTSIAAKYYNPDYASSFGNVGGSVALLVCNIAYFNKRKHLFVNR